MKYEMMGHVALELAPGRETTLEESFRRHLGREPLVDACPSCAAVGRREKRVEMVRWPRILVFHAKRWLRQEYFPGAVYMKERRRMCSPSGGKMNPET